MTLTQIKTQFPQFQFAPGQTFVWSPRSQTVFYQAEQLDSDYGQLALLHEVGHGLAGHKTYQLDIDLLNMEVEAWSQARALAARLGISIDDEHIDQCLETYRLWIYKRSLCPECESTSLQADARTYECFNCGARWQVAATRSLHPRRMALQTA